MLGNILFMVRGQRYSSFANSNNGSNLHTILIQVIRRKGPNPDRAAVGKGRLLFRTTLNKQNCARPVVCLSYFR